MESEIELIPKPNAKVVWLGNTPHINYYTKSKKGNSWAMVQLAFFQKMDTVTIHLPEEEGKWLIKTLEELKPNAPQKTFIILQKSYESTFENFELFWNSKSIQLLKNQLLVF